MARRAAPRVDDADLAIIPAGVGHDELVERLSRARTRPDQGEAVRAVLDVRQRLGRDGAHARLEPGHDGPDRERPRRDGDAPGVGVDVAGDDRERHRGSVETASRAQSSIGAGGDAEPEDDRGGGRRRGGRERGSRERSARTPAAGRSRVEREREAQVVAERDDRRDHADHGQVGLARVDRRREEVQLGQEAAGGREARQREQEERQRAAERPGASKPKPDEIGERRRVARISRSRTGDDGERAQVHRDVHGEVVDERAAGERRVGDDRDQEVAGLPDRASRRACA